MTKQDKVFFDTNVLVYQFDKTAPRKQQQAIELIEKYIANKQAVISSQVLQEFMNVSLKKFDTKLSIDQLELVMDDLLIPMCHHFPVFDYYKRALRFYSSNSISFYDALIIQAALDLNCRVLYSEDFQDGQKFDGLTIKNPFS
ncbi:MAG TPA: PIN domain-containing protein [Candidatus Saccharimonadales bacterium]|nr:PIN domain-containing protein [Candidatus Saccharimonadales bacterium]